MFIELFSDLGVQEIIYSLLLPFFLMFALLFGALEMVRLFNRRINIILSLVLTILATQSPLFPFFSQVISVYGIVAVISVFMAVFLIGSLRWGIATMERISGETGKLKKLYKLREKLWKEYEKALDRGDDATAKKILADVKSIDAEIEYLKGKLTQT